MTTSYSYRCSFNIMKMSYKIDTLIESLSNSQFYKPLKTLKSALSIFSFKKMIIL